MDIDEEIATSARRDEIERLRKRSNKPRVRREAHN